MEVLAVTLLPGATSQAVPVEPVAPSASTVVMVVLPVEPVVAARGTTVVALAAVQEGLARRGVSC